MGCLQIPPRTRHRCRLSVTASSYHFLSVPPATVRGAEELVVIFVLSTYSVLRVSAVISVNPAVTYVVDTIIIFMFANEETEAQSSQALTPSHTAELERCYVNTWACASNHDCSPTTFPLLKPCLLHAMPSTLLNPTHSSKLSVKAASSLKPLGLLQPETVSLAPHSSR